MPTALEVELKNYAHDLVADHLKEEYDSQIRRKWKPYINRMVDAQTEALNRHKNVLNQVRELLEKEKQAAFGLAMLGLSFIAGPAISWVAGKIQYHWFPKFASRVSQREVKASWGGIFVPLKIKDTDHDKVWAKMFGDLGKQVVGLGIDKALKVVAPSSDSAQKALQSVATADQVSFKTSLENALLAEADLTVKAIMSLALSILENPSYGAECLERLRRLDARARDPRVTESQLELMAKEMIRNDLNNHRRKWANEWFYYGNDPGPTAGLAESIELEMWALWILNEQFRVKFREVRDSIDGVLVARIPYAHGATFAEEGFPELVLRRLAEFGVVEARTSLQKLRATSARAAKEMVDKARALKEEQEADAAYWSGADQEELTQYPELARFKAAVAKHARKNQEQPPVAVADPDRPSISIGSSVDTQAEIKALESWAMNYRPMQVSGYLTHHRRTLPSIEMIHQ